jgi:ribosome biogenesis GTPase
MNKIYNDTVLTNGFIRKCLSGLYTVSTAEKTVKCRARGVFRKDGITPVAGDRVKIIEARCGDSVIVDIAPRKNVITRPPVANVDCLVFVVSTTQPEPNLLILDKFLAIASHKHIEPIIAVTKTDLAADQRILRIYENTANVFEIDYDDSTSINAITEKLAGKISVFTGNSGVGKSTLLNCIAPEINAKTSEISMKLGRGRHTTRAVELFPFHGGYVADTPGFSTFEMSKYDAIKREDLANCFVEFREYLEHGCEYADCSHTVEQGCEIIKNVLSGNIAPSRFESYTTIYSETPPTKNAFEKPKAPMSKLLSNAEKLSAEFAAEFVTNFKKREKDTN